MRKEIEVTGPKGTFRGYIDVRLNDEPVTFSNPFNECNTVCGFVEGNLLSRDLVTDKDLFDRVKSLESEIRRRLHILHDATTETERIKELKRLGYA